MSNNLDGLNDHLFAQINRLEKASSPEDLQQEISRSELLFINRKFARHHASMRPTIINIARLSSKSREVVW